jgi:plastocyanin
MLRVLARTIAAGVVATTLFACGSSNDVTGPPEAGTVTATTDLTFTPATITLARSGGSAAVTWTFQSTNHKVVFDTQPSGATVEGIPSTANASVVREFTVTGTYSYHCPFHDGMTGSVIIQ